MAARVLLLCIDHKIMVILPILMRYYNTIEF